MYFFGTKVCVVFFKQKTRGARIFDQKKKQGCVQFLSKTRGVCSFLFQKSVCSFKNKE